MANNLRGNISESKDSVFLTHIRHRDYFNKPDDKNSKRSEYFSYSFKTDSERIKQGIQLGPVQKVHSFLVSRSLDDDHNMEVARTDESVVTTSLLKHDDDEPMSPLLPKTVLFESIDDTIDKKEDFSKFFGAIEETVKVESVSREDNTPSIADHNILDENDVSDSNVINVRLTNSIGSLYAEAKLLREKLASARSLRSSMDSVLTSSFLATVPSVIDNEKKEEGQTDIITPGYLNVLGKDGQEVSEMKHSIKCEDPLVDTPIAQVNEDETPFFDQSFSVLNDVNEDSFSVLDLNDTDKKASDQAGEDGEDIDDDVSFGTTELDARAQSLITVHQSNVAWFRKFAAELELKYEQASKEGTVALKEANLRHREKMTELKNTYMTLSEQLDMIMAEMRSKQRKLTEAHNEVLGLLRVESAKKSSEVEQQIFECEVKFRADRHMRQKKAEGSQVHLSNEHIEEMYAFKYAHSTRINDLQTMLLKCKEEGCEVHSLQIKKYKELIRELVIETDLAKTDIVRRIDKVKLQIKESNEAYEEEIKSIEYGVNEMYGQLVDAVGSVSTTQSTLRTELDDAIGSLKVAYLNERRDAIPEGAEEEEESAGGTHELERTWNLGFSPVGPSRGPPIKTQQSSCFVNHSRFAFESSRILTRNRSTDAAIPTTSLSRADPQSTTTSPPRGPTQFDRPARTTSLSCADRQSTTTSPPHSPTQFDRPARTTSLSRADRQSTTTSPPRGASQFDRPARTMSLSRADRQSTTTSPPRGPTQFDRPARTTSLSCADRQSTTTSPPHSPTQFDRPARTTSLSRADRQSTTTSPPRGASQFDRPARTMSLSRVDRSFTRPVKHSSFARVARVSSLSCIDDNTQSDQSSTQTSVPPSCDKSTSPSLPHVDDSKPPLSLPQNGLSQRSTCDGATSPLIPIMERVPHVPSAHSCCDSSTSPFIPIFELYAPQITQHPPKVEERHPKDNSVKLFRSISQPRPQRVEASASPKASPLRKGLSVENKVSPRSIKSEHRMYSQGYSMQNEDDEIEDMVANVFEQMRIFAKKKGGRLKIVEIFREFDLNHDGTLDAPEMKHALARIGILSPTDDVVRAVMRAGDLNGDGMLDYKELLTMLRAPRLQDSTQVPDPGGIDQADESKVEIEEEEDDDSYEDKLENFSVSSEYALDDFSISTSSTHTFHVERAIDRRRAPLSKPLSLVERRSRLCSARRLPPLPPETPSSSSSASTKHPRSESSRPLPPRLTATDRTFIETDYDSPASFVGSVRSTDSSKESNRVPHESDVDQQIPKEEESSFGIGEDGSSQTAPGRYHEVNLEENEEDEEEEEEADENEGSYSFLKALCEKSSEQGAEDNEEDDADEDSLLNGEEGDHDDDEDNMSDSHLKSLCEKSSSSQASPNQENSTPLSLAERKALARDRSLDNTSKTPKSISSDSCNNHTKEDDEEEEEEAYQISLSEGDPSEYVASESQEEEEEEEEGEEEEDDDDEEEEEEEEEEEYQISLSEGDPSEYVASESQEEEEEEVEEGEEEEDDEEADDYAVSGSHTTGEGDKSNEYSSGGRGRTTQEMQSFLAKMEGRKSERSRSRSSSIGSQMSTDSVWDRVRESVEDADGVYRGFEKDVGKGRVNSNKLERALATLLEPQGSSNKPRVSFKTVMKKVNPSGAPWIEYKGLLAMLKGKGIYSTSKERALEELDVSGYSFDVAAELVWERMTMFGKIKGDLRALEVFREFDKDRSGKLSREEFQAALERLQIKGVSSGLVKALIKSADPNGDGKLEYKEVLIKWKNALLKPPPPVFASDDSGRSSSRSRSHSSTQEGQSSRERTVAFNVLSHIGGFIKREGGLRMLDLFNEADKNNTGKIDAANLKKVVEATGLEVVPREVQAVILLVDPHSNGKVVDFKLLLKKLVEFSVASHSSPKSSLKSFNPHGQTRMKRHIKAHPSSRRLFEDESRDSSPEKRLAMTETSEESHGSSLRKTDCRGRTTTDPTIELLMRENSDEEEDEEMNEFERERASRNQKRLLMHKMTELQSQIRVYARVKPFPPLQSKKPKVATFYDGNHDNALFVKRTATQKSRYEVDKLFRQEATQDEVFCATVKPLLLGFVAQAINVTVLGYGQANSGKTFTMSGGNLNARHYSGLNTVLSGESAKDDTLQGDEKESVGISYRAIRDVFKIIQDEGDPNAYSFTIEFVEIYGDTVFDLLDNFGAAVAKEHRSRTSRTSSKSSQRKSLDLREDLGETFVAGLSSHVVTSAREAQAFIAHGENRRTGSSSKDRSTHSSTTLLTFTCCRSIGHTSFAKMHDGYRSDSYDSDMSSLTEGTGMIKNKPSQRARNLHVEGDYVVSRLHLVDLAGSEQVSKATVSADRFKVSQATTRSLASLGDVMSALNRNHNGASGHIPFRNSKLTYLLKGSLSESGRVALITTISPLLEDAAETISSLNFTARCKPKHGNNSYVSSLEPGEAPRKKYEENKYLGF